MIFLVQFGINKHLEIFQWPQIALTLQARAYLFQITLKIMWLSIQTNR